MKDVEVRIHTPSFAIGLIAGVLATVGGMLLIGFIASLLAR